MPSINTFQDWWENYSDSVFKKVKDDAWYEAFEECWNTAQRLELQRCINVSIERLAYLAFEAQRNRAAEKNKLREFLDHTRKGEELS